MKLTKLLIGAFLMLLPFASKAQECDLDLMALVVPQAEELPQEVQQQLLNKLCASIVGQGVYATENYTQFFVAAKVNTLYKEVLPGPPAKTAMTLSLTLSVGDFLGQKTFNSAVLELKGVGTGEVRAYVNALRGLNAKNPKIQQLIADSKGKILDYYDRNYSKILAKAERCVGLKQYEEALFYVSSVPECCAGYAEASKATIRIYKQYMDYACQTLLAKARNAWAVSPDADGAEEVAFYLNMIDPDAACYDEVTALYKEVKEKVKDDWNFEVRKKYEDKVAIAKQTIEAAKAVGVAFGNGQKPTTTHLMWLK